VGSLVIIRVPITAESAGERILKIG